MYNRYIRTDDGTYTKVSEEETPSGQPRQEPRQDSPPPDGPPPFSPPPPFGGGEGIAGYLRRILDQLHLDRIDAGDLLLLGLLYFLFREKADEELLVALGLLLGRRRGALLGLMAGLAVDILVNEPYGLMTIIFTGAGFVSGFAGRKFMNHMWTTVLTPVAVFALMEGILFLYQAFARAAEVRLLAYGAARVGIQTAMVQVLYLLYNAILRPRLSRYGAR